MSRGPRTHSCPGSPLQIRYGEMTLDCEIRQASISGQSLGLTPYEFQLLRFLVDRVGRGRLDGRGGAPVKSSAIGYRRSPL